MREIRQWLRWHSLRQHILAPLWLRISEKHRWTVVHWLDKSQRRCWSDLVSDALAQREDDACDVSVPRLRMKAAPHCASTCYWMGGRIVGDHAGEHACACYCGKFQFAAAEGYDDRREANR